MNDISFNESYCDPETGVCKSSSLEELSLLRTENGLDKVELIYVGDPMCSWCWGLSPSLKKLRDRFAGDNIPFRLVVGGLRPGGGEAWNDRMKSMLKHHWAMVTEKSGQPFGFGLFDKEDFDYDTEPACRAVVAARPLANNTLLEFFEAIHRKFYVDSEDPKQLGFYESICRQAGIDFLEFTGRFQDETVREETFREFDLARSWGVQGFPSVLLSAKNQLSYVTHGFNTYDHLEKRVLALLDS